MKFKVMCEEYKPDGSCTLTVVKETEIITEAMDYIRNMDDPLKFHKTWELVVEGGFDDGINAKTLEREYEYENVHNGDYRTFKYYIEL